MIYFLPLLTAFLFRFRGMAKPYLGEHQGLIGMTLYVVPMSAIFMFMYYVPTILYPVLVWLPVTLPWGPYNKNWLALTGFGAVIGAPAIIMAVANPVAALVFFIGACTFGLVQYVASKIPSKIPNLNQGWELGEALYGFALGLSIILPIIWRT